MRLPTLSVIVLSQAVVWCVAGTAVHGPKILLYPLSWLVIGAGFYLHSKKYPISHSSSTDQTWANSKQPSQNEHPEGSDEPQKLATAE